MNELKSPHSWMWAILLVVFLFVLYYLIFFPWLNQVYLAQFWNTLSSCYSFDTEGECTVDNQGQAQGDLSLDFQIPKYVSDFVEREIVINIRNRSGKSRSVTLVVAPETQEHLNVRIRQDAKEAEGVQSGSMTFDIPAYATASGKIWLKAEECTRAGGRASPGVLGQSVPLRFYLQGHELTLQPKPDWPYVVPWKTLLHSFIKVILLPPWSNGLLPALAIAWAWYLEQAEPWGWRDALEQRLKLSQLFVLVLEWAGLFLLAILFLALTCLAVCCSATVPWGWIGVPTILLILCLISFFLLPWLAGKLLSRKKDEKPVLVQIAKQRKEQPTATGARRKKDEKPVLVQIAKPREEQPTATGAQ
jgi:hypothetical protein